MAKKKNKKEQSSTTGRPPLFSSPEEMETKIDQYFQDCPDYRQIATDNGVVKIPTPTITGLALYLGFSDRHSLYDQERKPAFSHTIKKARARMVKVYEMATQSGQCAGAIFMLKNFGYTDKTEIEHTGDLVLGYGHRKPAKH